MKALFQKLFGQPAASGTVRQRQRLRFDTWPAAVFAIGDVHGRVDLLRDLENQIVARGQDIDGEKWIVILGDLVDRGSDSAAVLDLVMSTPPEGYRRICLAGNHETMMCQFLASPSGRSDWLGFGGLETLASYGIATDRIIDANKRLLQELVQSHIPEEHIRFLEDLPGWVELPGTLLVHAGIRPGVPLAQQQDEDLFWIRSPFLETEDLGVRVIHGHTPVAEPEIKASRINIDTGAFATSRLTAAHLTPSGIEILTASLAGPQ